MQDLRWKGRDRKLTGPFGPYIEKGRGEFRPLQRIVSREAEEGSVLLHLECGHSVRRAASPVSCARCEHCYEAQR